MIRTETELSAARCAKSIELGDRAAETAEEARLQAEKALQDAKHKTEEWTKLAKEQADQLKTKGEKTLEESRQKIAETIKPKKTDVEAG